MPEKPLTRFRRPRLLLWCLALMAVIFIGLSIWGIHWVREQIQRSTFTTETRPLVVNIGIDMLNIPANFIRFEQQRLSKSHHQQVDLALLWPSLEGYSTEQAIAFETNTSSDRLLFLTLSDRKMRFDMSSRLQPIYSKLFDGQPKSGVANLVYQRLKIGTGYDGEFLAVGAVGDRFWVARCQDQTHVNPTCLRDVFVGKGLTLRYRMSVELLPEWKSLEARLLQRVDAFLAL